MSLPAWLSKVVIKANTEERNGISDCDCNHPADIGNVNTIPSLGDRLLARFNQDFIVDNQVSKWLQSNSSK